jgi:hypothetical protein
MNLDLVSLSMISGTLSTAAGRIRFDCSDGKAVIPCYISRESLDALIEFHSLDMSDASFDVLVKEIEAIVNGKLTAGRIEQGGTISIRQLDILRYAGLNR